MHGVADADPLNADGDELGHHHLNLVDLLTSFLATPR